jgi:Na+/phosphate symporter
MIATIALIKLIGYVVLLLWGMYMVQSGVVRAFGSSLRRVIGRTLRTDSPPWPPGWSLQPCCRAVPRLQ